MKSPRPRTLNLFSVHFLVPVLYPFTDLALIIVSVDTRHCLSGSCAVLSDTGPVLLSEHPHLAQSEQGVGPHDEVHAVPATSHVSRCLLHVTRDTCRTCPRRWCGGSLCSSGWPPAPSSPLSASRSPPPQTRTCSASSAAFYPLNFHIISRRKIFTCKKFFIYFAKILVK